MASNVAKECGVCNEVFNEEQHCPRTLPCFHSFCTECINQLIINIKKNCPTCRQDFEATSAQDFRINNSVLDLLKYIDELEAKVVVPHRGPTNSSYSKMINEFKRSNDELNNETLIRCQKVEDEIKNAIQNNSQLRDNILLRNIKVKNEILMKIGEKSAKNKRKIKYLEEENKRWESQLQAIEGEQKKIKVMKEKLDTAKTMKETASAIDDTEEFNTDVDIWLQDLKTFISRDEKTRLEIRKKAYISGDKLDIIQEILFSPEEEEDEINLIPIMGAIKEGAPRQITSETLQEMSDPVMRLLKQGRIFAIQQHERRCARISITDEDKLCLHHLTEGPLPPNVHIIQHDAVMRLVDVSSRLTFLELGPVRGSKVGRMKIRLHGDTKGAQHFALLCTGEMGPSYANTNILKVEDKGDDNDERVWFGEYESDGRGGKGLMSGLSQEWGRDEYKQPYVAGTVVGEWGGKEDAKAAQFIISTRDNPRQLCGSCIGKVEDGLQVLIEAISNYPDIGNVMIKDCGIVLPC